MTNPIERARAIEDVIAVAIYNAYEVREGLSYDEQSQNPSRLAARRAIAALAEEGLWPPEEIRRKALEEAAHWCEQEDVDNDPNDLYSGRAHRAAAIRALNSKEKE